MVPLIVEALGGIGRRGARCLRLLARRASCSQEARGRDGTTYSVYSRFHPANFLSHHLADIVTAAVYADARHIAENVVLLKSRAYGAKAPRRQTLPLTWLHLSKRVAYSRMCRT